MRDHSDLIERLQDRAASYRLGGPSSEHTALLLDQAASALSSQSLSLSEALERCAGWAVSFAKKCEEHQEALREIERLQAQENGPAGLADATNDPADSDLSSLRKGAEVAVTDAARDLLFHLELYDFSERDPSGELNEKMANLKAALVSGSREDGA